ncbi:MAG: NAD(P)/FAD-dependent oxidoreductase [Rhodopseudomonas palustris]|nr:NAD(P)/FAD-dependent oxidoreductase [Rhodopseudomonas palustris]
MASLGKGQNGTPVLAGYERDAFIRVWDEFRHNQRPAATILPRIARGYSEERKSRNSPTTSPRSVANESAMTSISRRTFGTLAAAGLASLAAPSLLHAKGSARLVIIGGGFGGASSARFARIAFPHIDVTVIEPQRSFVTCPYGNLLLAGSKTLSDITHDYGALKRRGVNFIHDWAEAIEPDVEAGQAARRQDRDAHDKLIVSPGIGIEQGALPGCEPGCGQDACRTPGCRAPANRCCCCASSWKLCPMAAWSGFCDSRPARAAARPAPMSASAWSRAISRSTSHAPKFWRSTPRMRSPNRACSRMPGTNSIRTDRMGARQQGWQGGRGRCQEQDLADRVWHLAQDRRWQCHPPAIGG